MHYIKYKKMIIKIKNKKKKYLNKNLINQKQKKQSKINNLKDD